ncbi:MAG: inorganic phosphate transporter [Bacteroidales bacterium]|nr:inorganic phosphate transporter [Bacteroidales bacterium]
MNTIYLILVIVLFLTAISDLIVGVSNDAVNFLNSAIGAKVSSFRLIMAVAALGIIVGATFSSGMMEVARKGIFHPQHFYFSEIIIIFLAVMITDVILLDLFNTFGMPTSTTVSIVFELLGAAVAISVIKIISDPNALQINEYINTAKALAIISGILLSVVIAFTTGVIIQYFSRLIFSFDYEKKIKRYGAIWGGLAITSITYFILVKGASGASFMSDEIKAFIQEKTLIIIVVSFVAWFLILQVITLLTRMNILKFIVLVGTFALAMAFAGNDLVNFIGVPLAGYESYKSFIASGVPADEFLMAGLAGKIKTPTFFLLIAGIIMVVTLWTSKKAKSVVKTSLDLGRQKEGYERFGSTYFSRSLVRNTSNIVRNIESHFPKKIRQRIDKSFDQTPFIKKQKSLKSEAPAFDLIRASVTLVLSSVLISFATSLKLPLSTTYVTFMVAMGTSLADRAWGRESAVYRITGVISVIGGWFFTAFLAFSSAFIMGFIIYYGGFILIFFLIAFATFVVYRTHSLHKKRMVQSLAKEATTLSVLTNSTIEKNCTSNITQILSKIAEIYIQTIEGLSDENLRKLRRIYKEVEKINLKTKDLKDNIGAIINHLEDSSIESGFYYVQVLDYLREIAHSITFISKPSLEHVDNHHKALLPVQIEEFKEISEKTEEFIQAVNDAIKKQQYTELPNIIELQQLILKMVDNSRKKQVKRIKSNEVGTRNSMLFLGILSETKNLMLQTVNMLKSHRDFSLSLLKLVETTIE